MRDQLSGGSVIQALGTAQVYSVGSLEAEQWGNNYTTADKLFTTANGSPKDTISVARLIMGVIGGIPPGTPPFSNSTTDFVSVRTRDLWSAGGT